MKSFLTSMSLLLVLAFSPNVAVAAEAWGYFSCTVKGEKETILVHSNPATYVYDAPAPPTDDSPTAFMVHFLAGQAAFSKALESLSPQFAALVEETLGARCVGGGKHYLLDHGHGPYETSQKALDARISAMQTFSAIYDTAERGPMRILEIDFPAKQ
jgi:hypothetical protein